jgi:hypothetical protein
MSETLPNEMTLQQVQQWLVDNDDLPVREAKPFIARLAQLLKPAQVGRELATLIYYIPSTAPTPNRLCQRLYDIAIHWDGSTWLIYHDSIPYNLMHEIDQVGGKWSCRRYHPDEQAGLLKDAGDMVLAAIRRAVQSCHARLTTIDEKDAADGGQAATYSERNKRSKDREKIRKELEEQLARLEKASKKYGIEQVVSGSMAEVRKFAARLGASEVDRAKAVAELTAKCVGTAMETAAKADEVPVGILADYVEDHGGDATAARVAIGQIEATATTTIGITPVVPPPPAEPITCTFARLRDGSWGVRTVVPASVGDLTWATRQRGGRQLVRLIEMSSRFAGGVRLWMFEEVEQPTPEPVIEQQIAQAELDNVPPPAAKPEKVVTTLVSKNKQFTRRYEINCTKAVVILFQGNVEQERMTRTREEAKADYAAQLSQGWIKLDLE